MGSTLPFRQCGAQILLFLRQLLLHCILNNAPITKMKGIYFHINMLFNRQRSTAPRMSKNIPEALTYVHSLKNYNVYKQNKKNLKSYNNPQPTVPPPRASLIIIQFRDIGTHQNLQIVKWRKIKHMIWALPLNHRFKTFFITLCQTSHNVNVNVLHNSGTQSLWSLQNAAEWQDDKSKPANIIFSIFIILFIYLQHAAKAQGRHTQTPNTQRTTTTTKRHRYSDLNRIKIIKILRLANQQVLGKTVTVTSYSALIFFLY